MSLERFWGSLDFKPDEFQVEAAEAIADDMSVVVTAPTGAGKTLVAEAAVHLVRERDQRIFYTTPIKALSNQKYADLTRAHGDDQVGLLTGDNVVNPDAPIIVATLEVLRNMIYADVDRLDDVGIVVLDEAHYLQDRSRGAAWEEVIIHCPSHIRFVCLSATISNNAQFADWISDRRGPTRLVTSEERPVPLEPMYMIKDRSGAHKVHLLDLFTMREGRRRTNPRLEHMLGMERGRRKRFRTPNRFDVVETLASERMLPAIYFIFSRAGCDTAARRLGEGGLRLTTTEEREAIRTKVEERTEHLSDTDLAVLGYSEWITTLESGVAAHHAGLVPAFKEIVEDLFESGLVKVVFATETLALGINMPARSVVIENLSKFNGESHEVLKPGDFTQLTGRAGRRGIDTVGYGVVLHSPYVRLRQVAEIASIGAHELRSSFRPTYNMTANMVANYEEEKALELLEASFAAFQRGDRDMARAERIRALEDKLAKEEAMAECELGSVEEDLATIEAAPPSHRREGVASMLGPGVVVDVNGGSKDGRYVVLKRLSSKNGGARYLVLGTSGRVSTIGVRQIPDASEKVAFIELPKPFRPRDRRFVNDTVKQLRKVPPRQRQMSPVATGVEHPVAECPDAGSHLAALRRARRIRITLEQQRSLRRTSGYGLVEEFKSIRAILEDLDYLSGWELQPRGEQLRRIYNESELLVAECLERGVFYGLDPSQLAALASVFVYDPRSDTNSVPNWNSDELDTRWKKVESIWAEITRLETAAKLSPTRRPDPGFGPVALEWASGTEFDDLEELSMAPGDFVRVSRQLADLLGQLGAASPELRDDAIAALKAVDRGVVAAQGVG